jgi:hypothetical protein
MMMMMMMMIIIIIIIISSSSSSNKGCSSSQTLGEWEFEFHLRHGCLREFILCMRCPVCR